MTKTKIAFIALFAILFGLWWGVPAYRKASADALVRKLCTKDGAAQVYETVSTPANKFDEFGELRVPHDRYRKAGDDFYYTNDRTWIVPEAESPHIWRTHYMLFRAADKKLLGEAVVYGRTGGDPLGPWHPSGFHCGASIKDLNKQVFTKKP